MDKVAWLATISSKAYNPDWWETLTLETKPGLWDGLREIVGKEQAAKPIPDWARDIVTRMMDLPMCGHYSYPDNVDQILEAIGTDACPRLVKGCYTADPERKLLLSYQVFCLDAWEKSAPLEHVIAELAGRDQLGKDWNAIATAVYETLGDRTGLKQLVIRRLIHRLRWWLKSLIWDEDKRDRFFLLDVYSGDIRGDEANWGAYGNSPYGDPYFAELNLPDVKVMEEQIKAELPCAEGLIDRIHSTWLCAPKVFRFLERLIIEIGGLGGEPKIPENLLQCEDSYPCTEANRQQFNELLQSLDDWMDGNTDMVRQLGASTPVKAWLVSLLRHRLGFHAEYEEGFAKLVGRR